MKNKYYDIGWLAGIIDGEGNFTIRVGVRFTKIFQKDRPRFWIEQTIVNTDFNLTDKVCSILKDLDISYRTCIRLRDMENSKPQKAITISTNGVMKLIPFIEEHSAKKEEIDIIKTALTYIKRKNQLLSNEILDNLVSSREALLEVHGNNAKKLSKKLIKEEYYLTDDEIETWKKFKKDLGDKMTKARNKKLDKGC